MTGVNKAISQIKSSAAAGQLVAVIGTGVSAALTNGKNDALSWRGLVENGFSYGLTKGKITSAQRQTWNGQLNSSDLDDLLSAAEFMGRKLDAPDGDLYARWLENVFKDIKPQNNGMANAVRALRSAGIPLCTLNYDSLLEQVTGSPGIHFGETLKVAAWMRREAQGILHLHGSWEAPSTCILGIRDYETTVSNDVRNLIQRNLGSFSRLLFIGCGDTFADPNFSALIKWLREKMKTAAPQHYALVNADEEARRNADPSWHGFVEPISYGAHHRDLPSFLLTQFPTTAVPKVKKKANSAKALPATVKHVKLLEQYRAFLLRDCGQMTIEGVRADMDTAQRRFDLERLFVPLKVLPTPPEIPVTDPQREQKLLKWQEKNKDPVPFGKIFAKHRHIALLALPGGGKTLLLKRLAVAYADPVRRNNSDDNLPDLDLTPVLIRCREWKEHIQRPIPVLLKNIAAITGQASLSDLSEALNPLFEKDRVLLLVDGLDEIHKDSERSTFVENLEAFLNQYKRIRLVVTSREAGFGLVAPSIARFCDRWRVAPLQGDAIKALCGHWHSLMIGNSPESLAEANDVAERLLQNDSLRQLAENPLLLTMLLVVKHGAGRLPPDRVSLYDRAVEVLLDTWNIKGHEPLNLKEAVPQLACVAFELMRTGKQTATERELLALLEEAREKVAQIRRYAKDTPDQFLKRVELRSSLLVEAGHQLEGARTVPFYQFRHLTFQEYLAAVAAVEGHYFDYQQGNTVLTPLAPYLTSEEWKEVIPMAAVLARKQAEPLIASLVMIANVLRQKIESGEKLSSDEWQFHKLPAAVSRLFQCLVEEAEAAPTTLAAALQVIALFARGCNTAENWQALSRGPYGEELLHQTWMLYARMQWQPEPWLINTFAALLVHRQSASDWQSEAGQTKLLCLLRSPNVDEITRGLLIIGGLCWPGRSKFALSLEVIAEVERHLFQREAAIQTAAAWTWVVAKLHGNTGVKPAPSVLDQFLVLWFRDDAAHVKGSAAYALNTILTDVRRNEWTPVLTDRQREIVREAANIKSEATNIKGEKQYFEEPVKLVAGLIVGFYAQDIWSDDELTDRLSVLIDSPSPIRQSVHAMLKQIGKKGRELLLRRAEANDKASGDRSQP